MNKEIQYVSPFKKLCITVGNLPTAYIESMSYYEGLTFLVNYLSNNVIPALNNNGQVVNELKDYVENYFENLDVQEEINNKLDKMAEDGTLQEIIASYLNSKAVFGFDNVASMKQATNLINGSYAETLGYYSKNDGGGATYKITDTESESEYQEELESGLYATLIIKDYIIPEMFGAYGDGVHDDTTALQNAINFNSNSVIKLNGDYLISDTITLERYTVLDGNNHSITSTASGISINLAPTDSSTRYQKIKNLNLNGNNGENSIGINMNYNQAGTIIENCVINNFNIGIEHGTHAWLNKIVNTRISNCNLAMNLKQDTNGFIIDKCMINNNKNGIYMYKGNKVVITNSEFENNDYDNTGYTIKIENSQSVTITNNYFENNGDRTDSTAIIKATGNCLCLNISNNLFNETVNSCSVDLESGYNYNALQLTNNYFFAGTNYVTTYDINLHDNACSNALIMNNHLQLLINGDRTKINNNALINLNNNNVEIGQMQINKELFFNDTIYNKTNKLYSVNNKLRFYGNNSNSPEWVFNFDNKKIEGFSILTGKTSNRPTNNISGILYYDTTLFKLIVSYDGHWYDMDHNNVD